MQSQTASRSTVEPLESRWLLSITPKLTPVTIKSGAINSDANLANFKTYDLQVTLDSGERWLSADLDASVTKGSFYRSPTNDSRFSQSSSWGGQPNLEFNTFVSTSGFGRPIILGQYNPTAANGGVFSTTATNVSWGALNDPGTGTFTVARLTVSKDANGTFAGRVSSTITINSQPKYFQFNIINGVPVVLSTISGTVYNDSNANGVKDTGEAPMSNVKLFLDKNTNGTADSGEKFRLSDSNGQYSFDSLTPGTYYVYEVTPAGNRRTQPTSSHYTCALSGVNGTGKNWGNTTKALVSGSVFNDINSNKKKDSNEGAPIAAFRIYLDTNTNGVLDAGEKFTDSDTKGYWVFKTLSASSKPYVVRIQSKAGYKTTTASSFSVTLASGATSTGHLFGEHKV